MNYCRTELQFAIHNVLNNYDYKIAHKLGRMTIVKKLATIIMTMPMNGGSEYNIDNRKVEVINSHDESHIIVTGLNQSRCSGFLWDIKRDLDSNIRCLVFMLNEAWKGNANIHKAHSRA